MRIKLVGRRLPLIPTTPPSAPPEHRLKWRQMQPTALISGSTIFFILFVIVLLLALNFVVFLTEILFFFFAASCCAPVVQVENKDKNQIGNIIEVFQIEAKANTRRRSSAQDIYYISIKTPPNRITRVKRQPNH